MNIKPIPGTLNYSASDCGVIFDQDNKRCNTYKNGDGYITTSVKFLDGSKRTVGVHRLVALAHVETDKDPNSLTVNHIDVDITNNHAYNLEWVSVYINNIHASLMRREVKFPTLIMTDVNGQKRFLNNLYEAAEVIKVDVPTAWEMVRDNVSINGFTLMPFLKRTKIPNELRKNNFKNRNVFGRPDEVAVSIKDLETGAIETYKSLKDAADRHETTSSHIFQCISNDTKTSLFKLKYLIVLENDDFPSLTAEQYEELKNPCGKETYMFNKKDGKLYIFPSASSMIKTFGLSKKAVSTALKKNGFGEQTEIIFAYAKQKETLLKKVKEFQLSSK